MRKQSAAKLITTGAIALQKRCRELESENEKLKSALEDALGALESLNRGNVPTETIISIEKVLEGYEK